MGEQRAAHRYWRLEQCDELLEQWPSWGGAASEIVASTTLHPDQGGHDIEVAERGPSFEALVQRCRARRDVFPLNGWTPPSSGCSC